MFQFKSPINAADEVGTSVALKNSISVALMQLAEQAKTGQK